MLNSNLTLVRRGVGVGGVVVHGMCICEHLSNSVFQSMWTCILEYKFDGGTVCWVAPRNGSREWDIKARSSGGHQPPHRSTLLPLPCQAVCSLGLALKVSAPPPTRPTSWGEASRDRCPRLREPGVLQQNPREINFPSLVQKSVLCFVPCCGNTGSVPED